MAQPDIAAVLTSLQVITDQLSLVPNIPTNNVLADRINHNQNILKEQIERMELTLITQIQNSQRQIQNTQRDLASQIDRVQQENDLLPMRLYNSGVSQRAPLRYPPGLVVQPGLPATAYDLNNFTLPQCIDAMNMLALPALPANTTISTRRRAIGQYLGVSVE